MITTSDLNPVHQVTIVGLNLVSDAPTVHFSPCVGHDIADCLPIVRAIEAAYADGERLYLGILPGHILDLEDWRNGQQHQAGVYTVFGFDWAAGEALALPVMAVGAATAVSEVSQAQPESFQPVGIAPGVFRWLPGSPLQDLAAQVATVSLTVV